MLYTKQESFLIERGFKMNLLKTILFIIFGMILIGCGGSSDNEDMVKAARVEDGVPKTEDGRIILSSESENLTIPEGILKDLRIDSARLSNEIAWRFRKISKVYDLSFASALYWREIGTFSEGLFAISFSVKIASRNASLKTYEGIECRGLVDKRENWDLYEYRIHIHECEHDRVELSKSPYIELEKIVADVDKEKLSRLEMPKQKKDKDVL